MSNEQMGKLIDLIADLILEARTDDVTSSEYMAQVIVGGIEAEYRIEPLKNTVEKEKP